MQEHSSAVKFNMTAPHQGFTAEDFLAYEQRLGHSRDNSSSTMPSFDPEASFKEASAMELALPPPAYTKNKTNVIISEKDAIDITENAPIKRCHPMVACLRYSVFNVYKRLFSIVFIGNMIGLIVLLTTTASVNKVSLPNLATATAANLVVAVLIRVDYIVNFLFHSCWLIPLSAPLRLRRVIAKAHEHGGIHSGSAVAATIWFVIFTSFMTYDYCRGLSISTANVAVTYVILALLLLLIVFAYPKLRFKMHNSFEVTHRLAGWTVVGLFWAEIGLLVHSMSKQTGRSAGLVLVQQPAFWFILIATVHIILPWLRLKYMEFIPERLSNHALRLHFKENLPPFRALALSNSPLREWHTFATFPSVDSEGGSLIISNAGDWTRQAINAPSTGYWVKGIPRTGVLSMATIFRSCVIVTTGSGIGPCLSFLGSTIRRQPCRLLWSTPDPLKTFGQDVVDLVRRLEPNAVIIDTKKAGRPDMVQLTYNLYLQTGAEAVFCISNPKVTRQVVFGMESRGVPAFGPIWDS